MLFCFCFFVLFEFGGWLAALYVYICYCYFQPINIYYNSPNQDHLVDFSYVLLLRIYGHAK